MTHYRKAGKVTHCGAEILPNGKDIMYIVIERVEFCEKVNIGGRTEENQFIAHFAPNPYTNLPMVLNRTNQGTLMKLFPEIGTDIDKLRNAPVRLTSEKARNIAMDMYLPALRISKIPANPKDNPNNPSKPSATQKTVLTKDNAKVWDQAVLFLKAGNDIEKIKAKYTVSEEVEKQLMEEVRIQSEEEQQNG